MTRASQRTEKEISNINCLCYQAHRLLSDLNCDEYTQKRILGNITDENFQYIVSRNAGRYVNERSVDVIRLFYEEVFFKSLSIAPHGKTIHDYWINRKDSLPFIQCTPIEYLSKNPHSNLYDLMQIITAKRLLLLFDNWSFSELGIQRLSLILESNPVSTYKILFIGKAMEVLFSTPSKRKQWMQTASPQFNGNAPSQWIENGDIEKLNAVYHYLYKLSDGAQSWFPIYDYNDAKEPSIRTLNKMKIKLHR